jgi:hypothetical protein
MFPHRRNSRKSLTFQNGEDGIANQRILNIKAKSDMYRHKVEILPKQHRRPTANRATPDDIVDMRDRSILTVDTLDSGLYSSDLLHQMEPMSDADSDMDRTLAGEYLAPAAQGSILVDESNMDEIEMDISLSSYYNDIMGVKSNRLSSWVEEDKPFDEVTNRQLSEKGEGDGIEAVLAGGVAVVREDVFPPLPASYDDLVELEENRTGRDIGSTSKASTRANQRKQSRIGRMHYIFICFLIAILTVGAVLVGLSLSQRSDGQQTSAIGSSSSESAENDNGSMEPSQSPLPGGDEDETSASPVVSPSADPLDPPPPPSPAQEEAAPTEDPTTSPSASPTELPTASPTSWPTSSPSASPTSWPTSSPSASPTSWPTSSPSPSPTSSPTISPTGEPTGCDNRISVVQKCYGGTTENAMEVEFTNCDPQEGDWVIIDRDGADYTDPAWVASNPFQFVYRCGVDLTCDGSTVVFGLGYPDEAATLSAVLLRGYLARQSLEEGGPFEIIAVSRKFALTFPCD